MKAEILRITPELAKQLLSKNTKNRSVKEHTVNFYKDQMTSGKWKENGESIIIDVNGVIKDGQHRLLAVSKTGFSYIAPVITEVSYDVMDTIDTGTNRSCADIFKLEGLSYPTYLAALCKSILKNAYNHHSSHSSKISNSDALLLAKENKDELYRVIEISKYIYDLQVVKVLPIGRISFLLYSYNCSKEMNRFLRMITGTDRVANTATDFVYKKLLLSKTGAQRLSMADKNMYIQKAYTNYIDKKNTAKGMRTIKNKSKNN